MIDRNNIFFVLVRPTYLGNIGSTARVLKNFGFKNLRLVAPPRNYKDAEARKMSVGAFDVLKAAQCFDSVSDALKDINIAVGTTCAYQRDCEPEYLDEVSAQLKSRTDDRIAVLFGDERDGLMREELDRCQYIVSVPTEKDFPSLNVAQTVGLFAYELMRKDAVSQENPVAESTASGAEIDEYFSRMKLLLWDMGFTKSFSEDRIMTELRTLFNKARPTVREMQLLEALLRKVDQSVDHDGAIPK